MGVVFDGPNKRINCLSGTTTLDMVEVYSSWKEWMLLSDNAKYQFAFTVIGGDEIAPGEYLGRTFFLENGWKIKPQEASHVLTVIGNLYSRDGLSPFVTTSGAYNVSIRSKFSNLIDMIATGGGSALTKEEIADEVMSRDVLTEENFLALK